MATFTAGNISTNMLELDVADYLWATPSIQTSTLIRSYYTPADYIELHGKFYYNSSGALTGGTVYGILDVYGYPVAGGYGYAPKYSISDISIPVLDLNNWVNTGDTFSAVDAIFSGNDQIFGSNYNDALFGWGGNDNINAGGGFDSAIYFWDHSFYSVVSYGGLVAVSDLFDRIDPLNSEGIDILKNVELLAFADGNFLPPTQQFDALHYNASYPDLASAFGWNGWAGFYHYVYSGVYEGRGVSFNGLEYIASYRDLCGAFGSNEYAGLEHYLNFGWSEGRVSTFNGLEYTASYPDLIAAFGANVDAGAAHFINSGRFEGRATTFDGLEYIASYADLLAAFGADDDAGATHFIISGNNEGRATTFDGLEYIASNEDLIIALGAFRDKGSRHFIEHGWDEGRETDTFDAAQYLANYPDLQAAFGDDLDAATVHYIQFGYFEGRVDDFIFV